MLKSIKGGRKAPFECPDCGCRLNVVSFDSLSDDEFGSHDTYFAHHFMGDFDRDAKNHLCKSLGAVWTIKGNTGTLKELT